nr:unnamed protein product [Callosobruchus analis]
MKIEFKENDKVFAKIKGYPAWPARVVSKDGKKYTVQFYGTGETAIKKAGGDGDPGNDSVVDESMNGSNNSIKSTRKVWEKGSQFLKKRLKKMLLHQKKKTNKDSVAETPIKDLEKKKDAIETPLKKLNRENNLKVK